MAPKKILVNTATLDKTNETISEILDDVGIYLKDAFEETIDAYSKPSATDNTDIVTVHDVEAEKRIVEAIKKRYPQHSIVTEEKLSSHTNSKFTWYIDPIDGTKNFAHHNPNFAISIALGFEGTIISSGVYAPMLNLKILAKLGRGAFLNGSDKKIVANQFPVNLEQSLWMIDVKRVGANFPIQGLRITGSAVIDAINITRNYSDGIYYSHIFPWDTAAVSLILTESGVKVTNVNADVYNVYTTSFLVANEVLHGKMQSYIKTKQ